MNADNIMLSLALQIELTSKSSDPEQEDLVTRKLLRFLRENDLLAQLPMQPAGPEGAKSVAAAEIGGIVLTLLPAAIPKVIELLDHWITRNGNSLVRVKLADGTEVEVKGGMPPAALEKLITTAKASAAQPSRTSTPGS